MDYEIKILYKNGTEKLYRINNISQTEINKLWSNTYESILKGINGNLSFSSVDGFNYIISTIEIVDVGFKQIK